MSGGIPPYGSGQQFNLQDYSFDFDESGDEALPTSAELEQYVVHEPPGGADEPDLVLLLGPQGSQLAPVGDDEDPNGPQSSVPHAADGYPDEDDANISSSQQQIDEYQEYASLIGPPEPEEDEKSVYASEPEEEDDEVEMQAKIFSNFWTLYSTCSAHRDFSPLEKFITKNREILKDGVILISDLEDLLQSKDYSHARKVASLGAFLNPGYPVYRLFEAVCCFKCEPQSASIRAILDSLRDENFPRRATLRRIITENQKDRAHVSQAFQEFFNRYQHLFVNDPPAIPLSPSSEDGDVELPGDSQLVSAAPFNDEDL